MVAATMNEAVGESAGTVREVPAAEARTGRIATARRASTCLALAVLFAGTAPLLAAGERVLYSTSFASGLSDWSIGTYCSAATGWSTGSGCAGGADPPPSPPEYARWGVTGDCGQYASAQARTRLRKNVIFTTECVWDLALSFDYLLDLQEDARYDRARVAAILTDQTRIFWKNGYDPTQSASCGGGENPSYWTPVLDNDGNWHPATRKLDLFDGAQIFGSALAHDVFDLVFEAETSDAAANLGRGWMIDDVEVTCTPRPSGDTELLATFDGDTPGGPPGPIEEGNLAVFPASWPVEVVDFGGDPQLMVEDASATENPNLIFTLVPLHSGPSEALVEYVFAGIESDGESGYEHGLVTYPDLNGPSLIWKSGENEGQVWLSTDYSSTADDYRLDELAWYPGERTKVVWTLSGDHDRFSVWVNDWPAALNVPFPHERIGWVWVGRAPNGQTGSYVVDDVRITDFAPIFADGFESGDTSAWSNG